MENMDTKEARQKTAEATRNKHLTDEERLDILEQVYDASLKGLDGIASGGKTKGMYVWLELASKAQLLISGHRRLVAEAALSDKKGMPLADKVRCVTLVLDGSETVAEP